MDNSCLFLSLIELGRLETPAEDTNQLENYSHLTPCNGIHDN